MRSRSWFFLLVARVDGLLEGDLHLQFGTLTERGLKRERAAQQLHAFFYADQPESVPVSDLSWLATHAPVSYAQFDAAGAWASTTSAARAPECFATLRRDSWVTRYRQSAMFG